MVVTRNGKNRNGEMFKMLEFNARNNQFLNSKLFTSHLSVLWGVVKDT